MPVGGNPLTWTGDVGAACGQAWEYGGMTHGELKNGQKYAPKCVWMDTDHGDDIDVDPTYITNRQMKIDMLAYGTDAAEKDLDYYCGSTIFTWQHDDPIAERPPEGYLVPAVIHPPTKRSLYNVTQGSRPRPRNQRSAERLIVSSRPSQSARFLCDSPTSRGSDFVSVAEGLFCDMETKTLYPVCSPSSVSACFDLDASNPHLRKAGPVGRRALAMMRYKRISRWE